MSTTRTLQDGAQLVYALHDARRLELLLFEDLNDDQLLGSQAHHVEPPLWEMGHVAWFQEYWILRHLDGRRPLHREFDEALAILAGDALLNRGLLCLAREPAVVDSASRAVAVEMVACWRVRRRT